MAIAVLAGVVTLYFVFPVLLYLVFVLLAVLCGAALAILQDGSYQRRSKETYPPPPEPRVEGVLSRIKVYPPPSVKLTLLSTTVDAHIQKVIDLTLKHHVIPTYQTIGKDEEAFFKSITPEIWSFLSVLVQRVGQIDTVKLISQDTVEAVRVHFEQYHGMLFRNAQLSPRFPNLESYPYLESPEHELNFLRQACEVLLCVCLPKDLLVCTPVRVLIREYLACHILQPTIEMICDPDYINQKLLAHLIRKEEAAKSAQKKYAYSATYEDFMKHIKKCEDIQELREIKQLIITDIIQAKAVYKMKTSRATGIHGGHFPIPIPAEKAKALMDRDLERYITQLGTAKTVCERQIRKMGGEDYQCESSPDDNFPETRIPLGIPFETIMRSNIAQQYFLQFLEQCGFSHLLQFWIDVESLKLAPSDSLQKAIERVQEEFLSPAAPSSIYANEEMVTALEESIGGSDMAPCLSTLVQIQESVFEELHSQFYQSFIASESYHEMMQPGSEASNSAFPALARLSEPPQCDSPVSDDDSRYKVKLKSLKIQLEEKEDALAAMPEKVHSSSLIQRHKALKKDQSFLTEEIKKLEHYIEHTEEWFGTIGQWSVDIHSIDISPEDNRDKNPLFIIVVTRPERARRQRASSGKITPVESFSYLEDLKKDLDDNGGKETLPSSENGSSSDASEWSEVEATYQSRAGWVVGRRLSEFQELHTKVAGICPNLQFPPLSIRLNPFQKLDARSNYWQKYRHALQSYLGVVLQDSKLQESEEVFNFLSPASENLRQTSLVPPEKKVHSFSLSVPGMGMFSKDHDEAKDDSVADHMYLLVSEIFELDEWSRMLRKQLVDLVQLMYGKSLDRELQEFVNWVVSEPMLVYYLETFQQAMWPEGQPTPSAPTRSDEQKAKTKDDARKRFLKNSPHAFQTILGQRNCQIGFQKIFEALQDPRANKQLFYSLFEILLYALVPELEEVEVEDSSNGGQEAKNKL